MGLFTVSQKIQRRHNHEKADLKHAACCFDGSWNAVCYETDRQCCGEGIRIR